MAQRSKSFEIRGDTGSAAASAIWTEPARALVEKAARFLRPGRDAALAARQARQARLDDGSETLDFRADTAAVRAERWRVAPIPAPLLDRRVEITGPAEPKMIVNALNSGANVFMADFEDSLSPRWDNVVTGQLALWQAAQGSLTFDDPRTGKHYALGEKTAVLMARPRGLHLDERHVLVDGEPAPAMAVDLPLYALHAGRALLARGAVPAFYIPKLERMEEAQLVDGLLSLVEDELRLSRGTLKVTVLIETLPAAFEMDEILFALREHIVGLNCGRWDYIFSALKRRRRDRGFILPDRAQVTMTQPFLAAYTTLLVQTCHRRGAFAMGGMAAQIPIKGDDERNAVAMQKVRADKDREAQAGHDGTWVAHPGLVPIAQAAFAAVLGDQQNQLHVLRDDVTVNAADLLRAPDGTRTDAGLRTNLRVGVRYLAAWLDGNGCVPIDDLMEDAATAEISRSQVWQWRDSGVVVGDGVVDEARLRRTLDEVTADLEGARLDEAKRLFLSLCLAPTLEEFLTVPAYARLAPSEV